MRRSIRTALCLVAAAVGCMVPSISRADTITATLTGLDPYTFGDVYLQGAGTLNGGVGNILWQGNSTNAAPFNGAFSTYCIDLIQDIGFGGVYSFTETSLQNAPKAAAFPGGSPMNGMGAAKATEIEEMYGQHFADTLGSSASAATDREAFQLAIWNIVYDTDASVSTGSGTFYATGDIDPNAIAAANGYLADALNTADQATFHATDLVALIGQNGAQDQVAINPLIPTTAETPLPSASWGGGLLLAGLAVARWRRQNLLRQSI